MPKGEAATGGFALDRDRMLALAYVAAARRPALAALWALDAGFGRAIAGRRDPMIGRLRLAWWREALEALDRDETPAEPVLRALQERVLPRGVTGAALARMEEGWAVLLGDAPLAAGELDDYARLRGGALFRHSAQLLGGEEPRLEAAGEMWALVDLARRSNARDAAAAIEAARQRRGPRSWPPRLRPLGMLAVLAGRDAGAGPRFEEPGTPRRMLRMIRMRLTGR